MAGRKETDREFTHQIFHLLRRKSLLRWRLSKEIPDQFPKLQHQDLLP